MVDLVVVAAFALLVLGVVGSVLPSMPGALLSVGGIFLYWWGSGYTEPGTLLLVGLLGVAVLAFVVDVLAGFLAAKVGGASTTAAVLAGVAGFLAFFVAGPLGIIVAVAGTVFVVEVVRGANVKAGGRAAAITTIGMLGSAVAQVVLTASVLIAMVLVVLL